jgi:hypothetical protein
MRKATVTPKATELALETRANALYEKTNCPQPSPALTTIERLAEPAAEDMFGPEYCSCDVYIVTLANCNGPLAVYEFAIDGEDSELWPVLEVEPI